MAAERTPGNYDQRRLRREALSVLKLISNDAVSGLIRQQHPQRAERLLEAAKNLQGIVNECTSKKAQPGAWPQDFNHDRIGTHIRPLVWRMRVHTDEDNIDGSGDSLGINEEGVVISRTPREFLEQLSRALISPEERQRRMEAEHGDLMKRIQGAQSREELRVAHAEMSGLAVPQDVLDWLGAMYDKVAIAIIKNRIDGSRNLDGIADAQEFMSPQEFPLYTINSRYLVDGLLEARAGDLLQNMIEPLSSLEELRSAKENIIDMFGAGVSSRGPIFAKIINQIDTKASQYFDQKLNEAFSTDIESAVGLSRDLQVAAEDFPFERGTKSQIFERLGAFLETVFGRSISAITPVAEGFSSLVELHRYAISTLTQGISPRLHYQFMNALEDSAHDALSRITTRADMSAWYEAVLRVPRMSDGLRVVAEELLQRQISSLEGEIDALGVDTFERAASNLQYECSHSTALDNQSRERLLRRLDTKIAPFAAQRLTSIRSMDECRELAFVLLNLVPECRHVLRTIDTRVMTYEKIAIRSVKNPNDLRFVIGRIFESSRRYPFSIANERELQALIFQKGISIFTKLIQEARDLKSLAEAARRGYETLAPYQTASVPFFQLADQLALRAIRSRSLTANRATLSVLESETRQFPFSAPDILTQAEASIAARRARL